MHDHLTQIYIPFHEWEGVGGPYTFMANLQRDMKNRGLTSCTSYLGAKTLFFPIQYDMEKLHWGRARGKRFIMRLDGVYYPQKHPDTWRQQNQKIKEIYRHYADLVIFQSEYSKRQCFEMFGEKDESQYAVIINGADPSTYHPSTSPRRNDGPVQFVTTGNFRDAAMLEPLILAIDQSTIPNGAKLEIIGPIHDKLQSLIDRDYVTCTGTLTAQQTAERLRDADVFLYSHLNPPCPNSVIEAISTGLPVVGFDSGAMAELLPWSADLLATVNDNTFQKYEDFDAGALAEKIQLVTQQLEHYRNLALKNAERYPFANCADQYYAAMGKVAATTTSTGPSRQGIIGKIAARASAQMNIDGRVRDAVLEQLTNTNREDFVGFVMEAIKRRTAELSPTPALNMMFDLQKEIYEMQGEQAVRYDDGRHTKHRHMNYHAFFVANVQPTDRILDLGCGKGELANSVAAAVPHGSVSGIDYRQTSIDTATTAFGHRDNLSFVHGDITKDLKGQSFDVVILSNVLEHIDKRLVLLKQCLDLFSPRQFLIRVPMYQRDWRVPLMDELGFDYRLDPEHFIEFTPETFATEMDEAGLKIAHIEYRWGEIWSQLEPK